MAKLTNYTLCHHHFVVTTRFNKATNFERRKADRHVLLYEQCRDMTASFFRLVLGCSEVKSNRWQEARGARTQCRERVHHIRSANILTPTPAGTTQQFSCFRIPHELLPSAVVTFGRHFRFISRQDLIFETADTLRSTFLSRPVAEAPSSVYSNSPQYKALVVGSARNI